MRVVLVKIMRRFFYGREVVVVGRLFLGFRSVVLVRDLGGSWRILLISNIYMFV